MEEGTSAPPPAGRGLWIAIAVVIVVVVVVVAAIFAAPLLFPASPEPIIGTVLPQTGQLDIFGPTMKQAVTLAAGHINDNGGLFNNVSLRVIHEDSQTQASGGVQAARKLIDVDGAVAIVGAASSRVSLPIVQGVTTPGRIVQISPASTSPQFTDFNADIPADDRFFFRTAPTDALQGVAGALYAFNEKGWRNMAILARADPYGTGLASVFEQKFVDLGGTITSRVDYNPDATSFTSELTEIFTPLPDAVYWVAFPGEGAVIMDQWNQNPAWSGPAWFWSEGTKAQGFVDQLIADGIDVTGMEGSAPVTSLAAQDNFDEFERLFKNDTGVELVLFEAHNYDATFLIALAMEQGGSARPEVIRDNLASVSSPPGIVVTVNEWAKAKEAIAAGEDINYQGASGFVDFDEFGDVGGDYEIWVIDPADGQFDRVRRYTETDLAASPPAPTMVSSVPVPEGLIIQPVAAVAARD